MVGCDWGALGNSTNTWSMSRKLTERNARHLWKLYRPYNGQWSDPTATLILALTICFSFRMSSSSFCNLFTNTFRLKGTECIGWMYRVAKRQCIANTFANDIPVDLGIYVLGSLCLLDMTWMFFNSEDRSQQIHSKQPTYMPTKLCVGIVRTISPSVPISPSLPRTDLRGWRL